MSNAVSVFNNDQPLGRIQELEAQLASCNEKILEGSGLPRHSVHYQKLLNTVEELSVEYRKRDDFDNEMCLYLSQQERFSRVSDKSVRESEFIPWEMCKGECCLHYKKKAEALQHLELAFQSSQDAMKDLVIKYFEYHQIEDQRPTWSMLWAPKHAKLLCQLYMDADRKEDAIGVASTCYTHVRDLVTRHPPLAEAFPPAFYSLMHWAEICGNIYTSCGQKYMARQVYEMTLRDMKRFEWDSKFTMLTSRGDRKWFTDIYQRKIERLGPDSDDEDGSEDEEPPIPFERRLKLVIIKPSEDASAPIECTAIVVDFEKTPEFMALSYAWGNARRVISYTRRDGPPYADGPSGDSSPPEVAIRLDGEEFKVRQTLHEGLRHIRQPKSKVTAWVDALCTGPQEMKNRAAWALKMKDIYKKAEEVVVWLGEGDEDVQKGMMFLEEFWDERPKLFSNGDLAHYLFGQDTSVPWEGLCKLLRAEWWKRIWTLQEFLVATKLSVRCGERAVHWRNLLEFTTFVDLEWITYQTSTARRDFLQPMVDLVRERHEYISLRDEYVIRSGCPLEMLWQMTKGHEAYDPRDKIYALLGIIDKPSAGHTPRINYDFCPCAVYTDMIVYRSIGDAKDRADRPLAASRNAGGMILLGCEHGGDSRNLKHIYKWDSERIEEKCDGEKCGRRLKCFSDGKPEIPSHWGMGKVLEHMEMTYKLYASMKVEESLVPGLVARLLRSDGLASLGR